MRQYILGAVLGLGGMTAAASPLTFTATVGGIATGPDLSFLTFDSTALPAAVTLSLDNAQIVTGSASGLCHALFLERQWRVLRREPGKWRGFDALSRR
jgi:hypothetical protein